MSSPVTRLRTLAALGRHSGLIWVRLILLIGLFGLAPLSFIPMLRLVIARTAKTIEYKGEMLNLARLSEKTSVSAGGQGNPAISMSDGHEVVTTYAGPEELQEALEQNQAQPLSLASADFDEDGVPDLVSGYGYQAGGIVSVLRGSVDAIYPNSPEAQQRRAAGSFTNAPFLSPARVFAAPVAADFVGAGDFDGDGHWDVVVAARTAKALELLSGDGRGGFASAREIALPGVVTAMTTGEMNRADGLTDLVIGISGERDSQVLVFEGPEGALRAEPEVFGLKAAATSLALGQLDSEYTMDLAIAAGNQLLIVRGRDRKLSLDESLRAKVLPAVTNRRIFDAHIGSIAIGHFTAADTQSIVVLGDDGSLRLLSQGNAVRRTSAAGGSIPTWKGDVFSSGSWSQAQAQLVSVHVSISAHDDLLVVDAADRQLHILNKEANSPLSNAVSPRSHLGASFDMASAPVAVLPMRLNGDALSDLMVLSNGKSAPVMLPTQATSTFVVTNTNGIGPGSLYEAILNANETPGADRIEFNIPGPGPFTITNSVGLPTITDLVTIDGTTQPGFAGSPLISVPAGLVLTPGNSTVRGLTTTNVNLQQNGDYVIEGNNIATLNASGNNNLIGGTTTAAGNTVSMLNIVNAAGNLVRGNLITTNVDVGNVDSASVNNTTVGGTMAGARNLIQGGNFNYSIAVTLAGSGNLLQGNLIGRTATPQGQSLFGEGVSVVFANNITIGGTVVAARNVISGYARNGFILNACSGILVQGNYIGTDVSGTAKMANGINGVWFYANASNVMIGGTTQGARNIISGSGNDGILFEGPGTTGNFVQGNLIGTDVTGTVALSNGVNGVEINGVNRLNSVTNNTVGGTSVAARNIISGSGKNGVLIDGSGATGNFVLGNYIGTDITGTVALGNGLNGMAFSAAGNSTGPTDNIIGGTTVGARNTISASALSGVLIEGPNTTGNFLQGNFIGTDATGTVAMGNGLNGVTTSEAPNNTIGGPTAEARNIISANLRHGVSIGIDTNSGSTGVTVQNNYIGTAVNGVDCLGNLRDGVFVNRGSVSHIIIDNLIACNGRNGVNIPNFATNDPGIRIQVIQNAVYANAALGIDLGDPGITANDPGDADIGANFLQNFPTLISFGPSTTSGGLVAGEEWLGLSGPEVPLKVNTLFTVTSQLNSTPNTAFTIHWYFSADQQCVTNQQGSRPLAYGKIPGVTTNSNGEAPFSFAFEFPPGMNSGIINATATDPNGNTSEFSACLPVNTPPPATTVQFSAAGYTVNEGAGNVTITVARSGNTAGASHVDFVASDGSAAQNQDYVATSGTLNFAASETSKSFDVLIVDDAFVEPNETINLTLSNATGGALAVPSTATVTITDNDTVGSTSPVAKRYAAMLDGAQETPANNSPAKGTGYVLLNQGETAASVSLQFQNLGSAETAAHIHGPGAPGVPAPILFTLPTTNPAIAQIMPTAQQLADLKAGLHYFNVHSNNFPSGEIRGQLRWNPTLEENFFVRQQYLDFLSRDGDPGGFGFWVNQVGSCQADAQCLHDRTITTSNAFFFEPEFQQTAGYVFRAYRAAYGNTQPFPNPDGSNASEANKLVDYATFVADRARVVGGANLAAAQQAFANQFVLRSAFTTKYAAATTAAQFVDAILANIQTADAADLTGQRQALIDQYNNGGGGNAGRAMVLYHLADDNPQNPINNQTFINAEYNRQFALTLYFGYLRRNPDIGGFLFWQSQINLAPIRDVPKQNALVCSFLTAAEYQLRFGPNAPRSNAECPQ